MPLIGFKERITATIRLQPDSPWAGNVRWAIVAAHPDMTDSDLYLGLFCYFYVRALNLADREPASAVHRVAVALARRLLRDEAVASLLSRIPDPLEDAAPLVAEDEMERLSSLVIAVSFGIANNGFSPGTVHMKKSSWRVLFPPASTLLLIRDLTQRFGESDRKRLALCVSTMAQEYERRGDLHVGGREAGVADPALRAAGVWKRG